MKRVLVTVGLLSVGSFVLHVAWESFHVGLYGGYEHLTTLPITVWATIGDVVYTLVVFLFFVLLKRTWTWLDRADCWDFVSLALVGSVIALLVEYRALAFGRWFYLEGMPIIPGFDVGLSPVAQMTVLLPLSFALARVLLMRIRPLNG